MPETKMAPADTLSRQDEIDTSLDNVNSTIYPELVVINTLDLALTRHIQTLSHSNPLVLRAIKGLQEGSPLFSHSALMDWTFEEGHLYYKGQMYIPLVACHTLIDSLHNSPALGHTGRFHTKMFLERNFWWLGLSTYVNKFIEGCAICQQNKVNTHPTCPPLNLVPSTTSLPFKQLSVDLVTDLPCVGNIDSMIAWSWLTMALQRG